RRDRNVKSFRKSEVRVLRPKTSSGKTIPSKSANGSSSSLPEEMEMAVPTPCLSAATAKFKLKNVSAPRVPQYAKNNGLRSMVCVKLGPSNLDLCLVKSGSEVRELPGAGISSFSRYMRMLIEGSAL